MVRFAETSEGIVFRCSQCGCLRIRDTAPVDAEAYGDAYRDEFDSGKAARCTEFFQAATQGRPPGRVLDVGCGDGDFLAAVAETGWVGTGLDVDEGAVLRARGRGIEAVCGYADPSSRLPGLFDAITLWDLIEHVPEPAETVRFVAEHLVEGGIAVVVTPNANSILDTCATIERFVTFGRSTRILDLCVNRYHLSRFTDQGLRMAFEAAGLRTLRSEPVRLFSLAPDSYGSGFAPGIKGWTRVAAVDRLLSRAAFAMLAVFRVRNKLLYVGEKRGGA